MKDILLNIADGLPDMEIFFMNIMGEFKLPRKDLFSQYRAVMFFDYWWIKPDNTMGLSDLDGNPFESVKIKREKDVDGRGVPVSNPNGPLDHDLFLLCVRDTVKLLRNHPSLALWKLTILVNFLMELAFISKDQCGMDLQMERETSLMDLTISKILKISSKTVSTTMGSNHRATMPVGFPVVATIRAAMPQEGWQIPIFKKLSDGYIEEVSNPVWTYHKCIPYSNPRTVHDQITLYGKVKDLDEFCEKAQLVNYIQYRALLEGWISRMWTKYTGVLQGRPFIRPCAKGKK
ncbi:hypothetical protein GIB67_039023 [Kingdonia uniflora]|uniref:Uncharacterized protein n=1 Tax=Kingdonia uniflora TaxID=39325 RepID=A0A7J7LL22_9MAGN|nr:hypothetical protein GIB67_039023 [Kingdonia uniflora]